MITAVRSLALRFYTYSFLGQFILIYPLYTLLFSDKGLSPDQIASLLVAWSATTFLLEVPSGALADRFDRKTLLIVATLLRLGGFLCWLASPTYVGFLLGFVLWGASAAFESGTLEAFVYDELARLKQTSLYSKITGRMESISLAAILLSGVVASIIAQYGYIPLLLLSAVALILSVVPLALLPSSRAVESTGETKYVSVLLMGVREAFLKPTVLIIILFSSVLAGIAASDEFHNLLFREKGFDNGAIALWLAIIGVFGVIGSALAHKLEKFTFRLELLLLLWGLLLAAGAYFGGLLSPLLIGLFMMVFQITKVIFNTRLQTKISTQSRATTTSVVGLLSELFALTVFGVVGLVAAQSSYAMSFYVLSAAIALFAAVLWLLAKFLPNRLSSIYKLGL